ncbi:MAG: glycosyltransferase family 9 protein [Prevotella sp.]
MKTDHLLIIRFSALGDVAMTVPVVWSLAHQYPKLRITVLSRPSARPFFENIAPNVGFMGADIKGEYKGMTGLNALYRRLTAKQFTAIADFHNILRSNYLRMRFNIDRYRVEHLDKHRAARRMLTSHGDKRFAPIPSAFDGYADVLARLGYPVKVEFTSIFPPAGGNLRLLEGKTGEKKAFQQWIGIAPFAAHKGKIYPLEKMEEVIAGIIRRHPSCRIFLFGGNGEEKKQLDTWAARYEHCTNASALFDGLHEELILMSHLNVMVSMDSANMHMASLVGTPVVSVWGATHHYAGFLGWNQKTEDIVQTDLPCRPCSIYGNKPCLRGDYACMTSIAPVAIADKVDAVLAR